jgi:regulator of protease activity HflC (stomatin/prohibitin superfamily)
VFAIVGFGIGTFFIVRQQEVAVIEFFGKFNRIVSSGLGIKIPFLEKVAYRVSLRISQLNVLVETKTKDNVFVKIIVSVQYLVNKDKIYEAVYKLTDVKEQISSYIYDVVRAEVPKMTLDEVFEKKDDLSLSIKNELGEVMDDFGYIILKAPVTDVDPDEKVKVAMNEINASKRLKEAAKEKAEAEKIKVVKAAEAEAESKRLQGEGIANQRKAIIEGLKDSIEDFKKSLGVESAQDVMNLVLLTQYFDTLKDIGAQAKTNTLLLPHSPGGLASLQEQIRQAVVEGNLASK